jgi:hypothetical protein
MPYDVFCALGAIIRKGGLGLPIVFAVLIFIIFHFINTFGKKVAQENGIPPFAGSWMSSFVLTPFAILFTYRATNDMNLSIDMDWLTVPFTKLFVVKGRKYCSPRLILLHLHRYRMMNGLLYRKWITIRLFYY